MSILRLNSDGTFQSSSQADVAAVAGAVPTSINDLTDVNISGVANGKILKYDSSTSKFIIADDTSTGITDVVSDTTPQLGGNLDLNSNNITGTGNIATVGTATLTPAAGTTPAVTFTCDMTGSSGNAANSADVAVIKKKYSNSSRFNQIKFMTNDGSSDYHIHSIASRRTGSGVNDKFFQIFEHSDDNSATPVELVKFKKNLNFTTSNNLAELQMTGRINLTISDADAMSNSNRTTINMDGTTTTSHNMLTGLLDFGSSSITNGAQVTFTADATNDAGGGASTPDRIGQMLFKYGATETDNTIEMRTQEHDGTTQSRLILQGQKAEVTVPFQLPSYTVANLPTTVSGGTLAYCSNETGGAVPVFYDGTNWRRVTDRAVAAT